MNEKQTAALRELESQFALPETKLREIIDSFIKAMEEGLEANGRNLAMIPTFVTGCPTGQEVGSYLALDLGGSNFRVCQVDLEG
ncbi:hypothetical protein K7432_015801, partial [Basidiobolus ranarum]